MTSERARRRDQVNTKERRSNEVPAHTIERFLSELETQRCLELENREARLCHQIAYTEINPLGEQTQRTTVYLGGCFANARAYDAQLFELARRGRRVVYMNPLEGILPHKEFDLYANTPGIPELLRRKASEVAHLMEDMHLDKVDIVGHSQGGSVAALVAAATPHRISNVVLDTPAGLVGNKSRAQLLLRAVDEAVAEFAFARGKSIKDDDSSYIDEWKERLLNDERGDSSRLFWRFKEEIRAIGATNINSVLADIQKYTMTGRPRVTLLSSYNDKIFRSEEIEASVRMHAEPLVDSWRMYADKDIGHGFLTKNDPKFLNILREGRAVDTGNAHVIADCLE